MEVDGDFKQRLPMRGARRAAPRRSLTEIQNLQAYVHILTNIGRIVNGAFAQGGDRFGEPQRREVLEFVENLCDELSRRDLWRLSSQEVSSFSKNRRANAL